MRCPYCSKSVVGQPEVVVIVGEGPAHKHCYEGHIIGQRTFRGLHLPSLELSELYELKEMLLTELNVRESLDANSVELFA